MAVGRGDQAPSEPQALLPRRLKDSLAARLLFPPAVIAPPAHKQVGGCFTSQESQVGSDGGELWGVGGCSWFCGGCCQSCFRLWNVLKQQVVCRSGTVEDGCGISFLSSSCCLTDHSNSWKSNTANQTLINRNSENVI